MTAAIIKGSRCTSKSLYKYLVCSTYESYNRDALKIYMCIEPPPVGEGIDGAGWDT